MIFKTELLQKVQYLEDGKSWQFRFSFVLKVLKQKHYDSCNIIFIINQIYSIFYMFPAADFGTLFTTKLISNNVKPCQTKVMSF